MHRRSLAKSDRVELCAPISSSLAPQPNPHSVRCTAATHLPRFRALALLGRRPPQRVDGLVIPASEKPAQKQSCVGRITSENIQFAAPSAGIVEPASAHCSFQFFRQELLDANYGIRSRFWVRGNDWGVTVRWNLHVRQLCFWLVRMVEGVKSVRIEMRINCRPTCRLFTRQHVFARRGGSEIVCFSHQEQHTLARLPIWLCGHKRRAVWVKGNRRPEVFVWWHAVW